MFGIGPLELLVIVVVAVVFVGPQRLPEVARQLGRFFVQARRMTNEARSSMEEVIRQAEVDLAREEREELKKLLSAKDAGTKPSPAPPAPEKTATPQPPPTVAKPTPEPRDETPDQGGESVLGGSEAYVSRSITSPTSDPSWESIDHVAPPVEGEPKVGPASVEDAKNTGA